MMLDLGVGNKNNVGLASEICHFVQRDTKIGDKVSWPSADEDVDGGCGVWRGGGDDNGTYAFMNRGVEYSCDSPNPKCHD